MDRLITAILNLTREGRREFEPVPIDTRELIEAIVGSLAHQARRRTPKIAIAPPAEHRQRPPCPGADFLQSDRQCDQISQAGRSRRTSPSAAGPSSGFAIFEVADNGRGIDAKDHQRIFDLFRRAGTQDQPGQGIGLAHVRALVRRLGGTMSVSSELHNGSTFTITLPVAWTASQPEQGFMSKPVTIIMIEDDEGHARLIERNIRRSGVNNEIMPFANGTAAVDYFFGADGTGIDHKASRC